ncbi:MAG: TerD family protein [Kineosporiaceae bacterium]|nr:TerD family protein [Kineosporiaceae bacterium]MBK7624429.1 TerD family protein [Kineosporiaceae bacterium]MBK8077793.1 TerD family protein [Kineosporiaceae bacterium]
MAISLTKGGNVSLEKAAPGMTHVTVGLGWNPRTTDGAPFDLDASCLLLTTEGRVGSDRDFIFYNNTHGGDGAIHHTGDNRTGDGEGDDEQINVDLPRIPGWVDRVVFVASIDKAAERGQNFGQVGAAYIRVFDADDPANDARGARFDLGEEAATETALIFGELYRYNSEWKFRAVAQGYTSGLAGVLTDFGISVA